jgi:hypothetical protein
MSPMTRIPVLRGARSLAGLYWDLARRPTGVLGLRLAPVLDRFMNNHPSMERGHGKMMPVNKRLFLVILRVPIPIKLPIDARGKEGAYEEF